MAIHIDVLAEINQRKIDREVDRMADKLEAGGIRGGRGLGDGVADGITQSTPRIDRALDHIQSKMADLRKEQQAYNKNLGDGNSVTAKAVSESGRLAAARRTEAAAHRDAGSAARKSGDALEDVEKKGKRAVTTVENLGRSSFGIGRGTLVAGLSVLGPLLLDTAETAVTATQSIYLLPAALAAVGAGMGTVKLATAQFGQAMKDIRDPEKFATDLATMGSEAQQAALSMRALLPEFDNLRKATENAFFDKMGQRFEEMANTFGPSLQRMTTSVAGSMNQAMSGVANQLMTPENMGNVNTILDDIARTFDNLVPAATSFSQAFTNITAAGASFLPSLATDISRVAEEFNNFITNARQTGDLQRWISEGIDAVKLLGQAVWEIGTIIYNVFGSDAQNNLKGFKDDLQGVHEIGQMLAGDFGSWNDSMKESPTFLADIRQELDMMQGPAAAVRDFFNNYSFYMDRMGDKTVDFANTVIDTFNKLTTGPFNQLLQKITQMMNLLPGPDQPLDFGNIPQIPHIPHAGTGATFTPWSTQPDNTPGGPFSNQNYSGPSANNPDLKPTQWTDPKTGKQMVMVPGIGWLPADDPRAVHGGHGGPYDVPAPPPTDANGKKLSDKDRRDQMAMGLDPSLYKVDPYAGLPAPGAGTGTVPGAFGFTPAQQRQQDILEAQHQVEDQAHSLEEAKRDRLVLERDNTATAKEIEDAKWKEIKAGWDLQKSQANLADKMYGTTKDMQNGMDQLGVALDPDLGLSKGLSGFAENLTKMVGNMITRPFEEQMQATMNADPIKGGFGLLGIMGAKNIAAGKSPLLGRDYPGDNSLGQLATGSGSSSYGPGTTTGMPAAQALPGESPRDFAHRTMMPFFQQQGFQVGDHAADKYGEHQNGALDVMVNNLADGSRVLQQALNDPNVKGAIFNNQTYGYGHGATPQDYSAGHTGDPSQDHTNHVHILYKPGDPNNINPNGTGGMPAGAGMGMDFSASGATPVYVVNMPGGGGGGLFGGGGGFPLGSPASGQGTGPAPGPTAGGSGFNWDAIAGAEASGNWANKSNPKYQGGLQFDPSTWARVKPVGAPDNAADATREQQIAGAEALIRTGATPATQWPATFKAHPEWFQPSPGALGNPADLFTGGGGEGPIFKKSGGGAASINGIASASGTGSGDLHQGKTYTPPGMEYGPAAIAGMSGIPNAPGGIPGGPMGGPVPGSIGPFPVPPGVADAAPGGIGNSATLQPGMGSSTSSWAPNIGPGPLQPGAGGAQANPTPIGGLTPGVAMGGSGGIGASPDLMALATTAASALDVMAPGAGQAAATGMKLANRAIEYGSQLAGIGVSGLMETFLPTGGSELANSGWIPRIVGGIAGAKPALPNIAGGKDGGNQVQGPLTPEQATNQHLGTGAPPGPNVNVEYNSVGQTEDQNGKDLAYHLGKQYAGANA